MSDPKARTLFRVCPKGIKSDSNESKKRAQEELRRKPKQQTTLSNIRRLLWHLMIKSTGHQEAQLENYGTSLSFAVPYNFNIIFFNSIFYLNIFNYCINHSSKTTNLFFHHKRRNDLLYGEYFFTLCLGSPKITNVPRLYRRQTYSQRGTGRKARQSIGVL